MNQQFKAAQDAMPTITWEHDRIARHYWNAAIHAAVAREAGCEPRLAGAAIRALTVPQIDRQDKDGLADREKRERRAT